MPRAQDATTWTPQLKRKNPASEGPVIWTKADRRDGSRPTSGGGDTGTPAPNGEYIPFGRPGGTIDPAFSISDFVYQGSFKVQFGDAVGSTSYAKGTFAYRAPDGSNGVNGSFFFDSIYGPKVAEFQIPATLSSTSETNRDALPAATNLQGYIDVQAASTSTQDTDRVGWMKVIDGKLWVTSYKGYNTGGNTGSTVVFSNAANLTASTVHGQFLIEGGDYAVNYCSELPDTYKTLFGATHLVGNCKGMSIASRTSMGPSLLTMDLTNYVGNETIIPTTQRVAWNPATYGFGAPLYPRPATAQFGDQAYWDTYNEATAGHYFNGQLGFATYDEWRLSSPRTEWNTLPKPAASIRNDLFNIIAGGWNGFIVPGTNTFLVIGKQSGNEFGVGYKPTSIQGNGNGGPAPFDDFDHDAYYWAVNMNDIINATTPDDVLPFEYGRFDDNRWVSFGGGQAFGLPSGGEFDPATGKLFVTHGSIHNGPAVVSVYQLGGA